jgi:hypothetical protein
MPADEEEAVIFRFAHDGHLGAGDVGNQGVCRR